MILLFINIRKVPRDLTDVNEWKIMFDPSIKVLCVDINQLSIEKFYHYGLAPCIDEILCFIQIKTVHGIVGDREIMLRDPTGSANKNGIIYIDLIDPKSKRKLKPSESLVRGQYVDRVTYTDRKF